MPGTDEQEPDFTGESITVSAVRGPDFRYLYANTHRLRTTLNDMTITFGTVTDPIKENDKFSVYDHAQISMNLGQLNNLMRELTVYFDELDKLGVKFNVNKKEQQDAEERTRQMVRSVFKKEAVQSAT